MHSTIKRMTEVIASGDDSKINDLLATEVQFLPPTYWATWTGREPVAMLLGHVGAIFEEFRYRRILGEGKDWILEFECKVGDLNAVGVDLITLDDDGLIEKFEVAIRPYKTVKALREAMNARVMSDPRFLKHRDAVTRG